MLKGGDICSRVYVPQIDPIGRPGSKDCPIRGKRHRSDPTRMRLKGSDTVWRNFGKRKRGVAHISILINDLDMNRMPHRVRKTRRARRRNNAVIVEFNYGLSFARQSTTRFHFKKSSSGSGCRANRKNQLVKSI